MNKVMLDPALREKLNGLNDELEVCDEHGKTLGFFVPPAVHHRLLYGWAKSLFTDEELREAREDYRKNGGMTTAEAIAYVEKIARDAKGNKS